MIKTRRIKHRNPTSHLALRSHMSIGHACLIASVWSLATINNASAQTLSVATPFLYYLNLGYSDDPVLGSAGVDIFGVPGSYIGYGVDVQLDTTPTPTIAIPPQVTGSVTNPAYSPTELPFGPNSEPVSPYLWYGQTPQCLTCPSAPFTFKFNGPGGQSVSKQATLSGPGQIPFVQNVTLSGTTSNPTFSWSPPPGSNFQGYQVQIWQDSPSMYVTAPPEAVVTVRTPETTFTVQASEFTIPHYSFEDNAVYTIEIEALTTKDGTKNLVSPNTAAESRVYLTFDTLPDGSPTVNLPTVVAYSGGVKYGFNMTVATGQTYYIDPAVATGYVYQIGSGNPDFASVELPSVGNPTPYELLSWNGSKFVFDAYLPAGEVYDFGGGGVSEFEVLGIDPRLGLDPNDTTAFITGLTFESAGAFTGTMTPVTTSIPESSTWAMLLAGFAGLGFAAYRRARSATVHKTYGQTSATLAGIAEVMSDNDIAAQRNRTANRIVLLLLAGVLASNSALPANAGQRVALPNGQVISFGAQSAHKTKTRRSTYIMQKEQGPASVAWHILAGTPTIIWDPGDKEVVAGWMRSNSGQAIINKWMTKGDTQGRVFHNADVILKDYFSASSR